MDGTSESFQYTPPSWSLTKPSKDLKTVVFPEPLDPMISRFFPASRVKLTPCNTSSPDLRQFRFFTFSMFDTLD